MPTSPPPTPSSSSANAAMWAAGSAVALLIYIHQVLSGNSPGSPGAGERSSGDLPALLSLAFALAGLAGSAAALVAGGRHGTVGDRLAVPSTISCAVACGLLLAPHAIAHPHILSLAILLGCTIAAIACYGRYTAAWQFTKDWVRSWMGPRPLPDIERGGA